MAHYEAALQVAREIGASLEEARSLEGIGHCLITTGALTEGTKRLGQAPDAYQRLGAPEAQVVQGLPRDSPIRCDYLADRGNGVTGIGDEGVTSPDRSSGGTSSRAGPRR
jgi:hypothetical protein